MKRIAVAATVLILALPGGGSAQDAPKPPASPPAAAPPPKPPEPRLPKDPKIRAAVQSGLDWLARHQAEDGRWDGDGFASRCKGKPCEGPAAGPHDAGLTGLALRAFTAGGHSAKTESFGPAIGRGLGFLRGAQDKEGCFGARTTLHFVYDHAAASLAWNEIYRDSREPEMEGPARAGTAFTLACRNPDRAWRYGIRPGEDDTSVTGWMISGLAAARDAGIEVDPKAFEGAIAWLNIVTDPETGRAGYTRRGNGPARPQDVMDLFRPDRTESLTAIAIHTRLACGQKPDYFLIPLGLGLLGKCLPAWDRRSGTIDLYYWAFGTSAVRESSNAALWKSWKAAATKALLEGQHGAGDGCACGSWDAADPWAKDGGRVYSTALACVILAECDRPLVPLPKK